MMSDHLVTVEVVLFVGKNSPDGSTCSLEVLRVWDHGVLRPLRASKTTSEALEETAVRLVREQVGDEPKALKIVEASVGDAQDEVVITYFAVAKDLVGELREGAELTPMKALKEDEKVEKALNLLGSLVTTTDIILCFVPEVFTLGQLRGAYEEIWRKKLDVRNFRRKLVDAPKPFVQGLGFFSHRGVMGRPPMLYRATDIWKTRSPVSP